MSKNLCNKERPVSDPYEIWVGADEESEGWEWRVLKKWQTPEREAKNPEARWMCAVRSPHTYGSWEYGDVYVHEITSHAVRTYVDREEQDEGE